MSSLSSKGTAVLLLVIAVAVQTQMAQAQSCTNQLSNLNVCGPFLVPGSSSTPNSECCGALQAVQKDCLCNTFRIANRLPTQCNIQPITCDA